MVVFIFGVRDFFSDQPSLTRNEFIDKKAELAEYIYLQSTRMVNRNPICKLFYVTTGNWTGESDLQARIDSGINDLMGLNIFDDAVFEPLGASGIQRLYQSTKTGVSTEIIFESKVVLPDINGVDQSYIGILPASEYLKLITDDKGNIRKSIFYDNVRDYQGNNLVNQEIARTLHSEAANRFLILNNGVTMIANSIRPVGNRFTLQGYQVVNGCQTSHVIYNVLNKETQEKTQNIFVPVKIISLSDEEIISQVIKSTNNQTEVKPEQLTALSAFQKNLEGYYSTYEGANRLYYERRSRQYDGEPGVEKVRIITIPVQIKVFASMFLQRPNRAWGYSGSLWNEVEKSIFVQNHELIPYFTSALAYYKLEFMFRNSILEKKYRKFRYHLLMILRYQVGGREVPDLHVNRRIEPYCQNIIDILSEQGSAISSFEAATEIIDSLVSPEDDDRDIVKNQSFTESVLHELQSST